MWNVQNYLEKSKSQTTCCQTPISDLQLLWEGSCKIEERRELVFSNVSLSEWKQSSEFPVRCFSFQTSVMFHRVLFNMPALSKQVVLNTNLSPCIWCIVISRHLDQHCILSFEYLHFGCCSPKHHNVVCWISHWTIFLEVRERNRRLCILKSTRVYKSHIGKHVLK